MSKVDILVDSIKELVKEFLTGKVEIHPSVLAEKLKRLAELPEALKKFLELGLDPKSNYLFGAFGDMIQEAIKHNNDFQCISDFKVLQPHLLELFKDNSLRYYIMKIFWKAGGAAEEAIPKIAEYVEKYDGDEDKYQDEKVYRLALNTLCEIGKCLSTDNQNRIKAKETLGKVQDGRTSVPHDFERWARVCYEEL